MPLPNALTALRRPRLLVRAARFALADYDRGRDLRRVLRADPPHAAPRAVAVLLEQEGRADAARRRGDGTYDAARHVATLAALMAEARRLAAA